MRSEYIIGIGRAAVAGLGVLGIVLACGMVATVQAVEPPMELKWDQLVPPAPPKPLKPFFAGRDNGAPTHTTTPEGRWMSTPSGPSSAAPAPVVHGLDGKRVHIGGYVVPLDFEAMRVKEFLLVPFVGACIHVPPPPANQIVYVKAEQGFDVQGTFDPVWVTGTLKVTPAFTGLAEAGAPVNAAGKGGEVRHRHTRDFGQSLMSEKCLVCSDEHIGKGEQAPARRRAESGRRDLRKDALLR
jgi:hypothetical protein